MDLFVCFGWLVGFFGYCLGFFCLCVFDVGFFVWFGFVVCCLWVLVFCFYLCTVLIDFFGF